MEEETAGGTRRRGVAETADVINRREVDRKRHRYRAKDSQHHAGQHPYKLLPLHILRKGTKKALRPMPKECAPRDDGVLCDPVYLSRASDSSDSSDNIVLQAVWLILLSYTPKMRHP